MSRDLIQRLQRLQRGFSKLCSSETAAGALFDEAQAFSKACSVSKLQEPAEVSGSLAALLQQFVALNRMLPDVVDDPAALAAQFNAACVAIRGCALLADRLPMGQSEAFRLASSLELVFSSGLFYLQLRNDQDLAEPINLVGLLVECKHQLAAVGTALQRAADPQRQPAAVAAFVRTTGRPQAVLAWLLAISQALLKVPADFGASCDKCLRRQGITETGTLATTLQSFIAVAISILGWLSDTYYSTVQQAPATQQAVVSVLLDRCLALMAADCSAETLAGPSHPHCIMAEFLPQAVGVPCLDSVLEQRMEGRKGTACIWQALKVVAALPRQRSAADVSGAFGEQHAGATALLACLCSQWTGVPQGSGGDARWCIIKVLPRIAAMLAGLAGDSGISAEHLARTCHQLQTPLLLVNRLLRTIDSESRLAAWAQAADASLRLLPSLWQLHERYQAVLGPPLRFAPHLLALHLLSLLDKVNAVAEYAPVQQLGARPAAANERLARQLWALHTSMCRLLAWLAADPSGARAAMLPRGTAQGAAVLLESFSALRSVLVWATAGCIENGVLSEKCLHGMCAAHWAAIQAAIQLLGGLPGCGDALRHVMADLHSICVNCPALLTDSSLLALFNDVTEQLAPVLVKHPELVAVVAGAACDMPQLAAAMARGGALRLLAKEAQQLVRSGNITGVAGLAGILQGALWNLDGGAAGSVVALRTTGAQHDQLLHELRQAAGVSAGLQCVGDTTEAALLAQLPKLICQLSSRLPAAAKLADLLHQWWQPAMQPELHAEAQLALAQAAAGRSCAYLRCANLGGEGGSAAGEGVGSMRCSACRAVWYCGTACSHADWREGGHCRMCKALGAARRAAKAASKAAAA